MYTRRRDTGHSASAKSPWTRTLNSPLIFTVTSRRGFYIVNCILYCSHSAKVRYIHTVYTIQTVCTVRSFFWEGTALLCKLLCRCIRMRTWRLLPPTERGGHYYVNYYVDVHVRVHRVCSRRCGGWSCCCRMAARSTKEQWRAFLVQLVSKGDRTKLTPRTAFAALCKQFGEDVRAEQRVWCKDTVRAISDAHAVAALRAHQ